MRTERVRLVILAFLVTIPLIFLWHNKVTLLQEQVNSLMSSKDYNELSKLRIEVSCSKKGIHPSGGFCLNPDNPIIGGNQNFDGKLCSGLEEIFGNSTVGDFGAGLGHYGACFLRAGKSLVKTAKKGTLDFLLKNYEKGMKMANLSDKPQVIRSWEGFDGARNIDEVSGGQIQYADLSEPLNLGRKYDWVMSLEVGEHIPREKEDNFIGNLVEHACKGIAVSWAVVGQGGHHHVNNRNNDYIEKKMKEKGLQIDQTATKELRKNCYYGYFKNTVMVYRFPSSRC